MRRVDDIMWYYILAYNTQLFEPLQSSQAKGIRPLIVNTGVLVAILFAALKRPMRGGIW